MIWNEQCQEAFKKIKNYLIKPPILIPPVPEKPLLLYLVVSHNYGYSNRGFACSVPRGV